MMGDDESNGSGSNSTDASYCISMPVNMQNTFLLG